MLDVNTIDIKSSEDLQEALSIKHSANEFEGNFKAMVDRWGLDNSVSMLAQALCGTGSLKPMLKFTKKLVVDNPDDMYEEPRVVNIE